MNTAEKTALREFLAGALAEAGDRGALADDSSLFLSGRLDSLAMTRLVVFLEEKFAVDFGAVDFDVELVDTVNDIGAFIEAAAARQD